MGSRVLHLNDFFYFVQVVDRGGFTAAGRTLRIPKSTLSHRIQQLETNLGVRLLNRTSRRFGMTEAGEEFYRHAVVMLREAELAETAIRHRLNVRHAFTSQDQGNPHLQKDGESSRSSTPARPYQDREYGPLSRDRGG
jgi:hypothetical protein